jgi:hypothetical protein
MKKVLLTLCIGVMTSFVIAQNTPLPNSSGPLTPPGRDILAGCANEKGTSDFPFTEDGITATLSGTGSYTNYGSPWTSCGITTKPNSMYIGYGPGSFTITFSQPVNDLVFNVTAADNTGGELEVLTLTTDAGTPAITYTDGTCPAANVISGNTITFPGYDVGGRFLAHSSSDFSSITFSHNGINAGLLITVCTDLIVEPPPNAIPISNWALFAGIALIMIFAVVRFRKLV